MTKLSELLREGTIIGVCVATVLLAAEHVAATRTSPAQHQALGISLSWLGLAAWGARRPERHVGEAIIVGAVIATVVGLAVRLVEWATAQHTASVERRAVAALERSRTEER